jgi:hypothetical protein
MILFEFEMNEVENKGRVMPPLFSYKIYCNTARAELWLSLLYLSMGLRFEGYLAALWEGFVLYVLCLTILM